MNIFETDTIQNPAPRGCVIRGSAAAAAAPVAPPSLVTSSAGRRSEDGASAAAGLRVIRRVRFLLVAENAEGAHVRAPLVVDRRHRDHAHPLSLRKNKHNNNGVIAVDRTGSSHGGGGVLQR